MAAVGGTGQQLSHGQKEHVRRPLKRQKFSAAEPTFSHQSSPYAPSGGTFLFGCGFRQQDAALSLRMTQGIRRALCPVSRHVRPGMQTEHVLAQLAQLRCNNGGNFNELN